ncbi:MAG: DUF1304 domain-containing protein [Maritimibacter sp.]|nr:DUF1304 domain-containing protein [Maritimibacter sp.]
MIATLLALAVAALHLWFLVLEMLLWEQPRTRKLFSTTEAFAAETKVMAANQGLYNGFLAAGILLGLWRDPFLLAFALACVVVAGLYGALTVGPRVALVQALPAALALGALAAGL